MFVAAPIPIATLGLCSGAALLWRQRGATGITVAVKATFEPRGQRLDLATPEPLIVRDQHVDKSPSRSLERAGELAPYLPGAGVVAFAQAHVLGPPVTTLRVRLVYGRGTERLIDKRLLVYGDRDASEPSEIKPFMSMPIDYEHALGGRAQPDNPVGCGDGGRLPNVLDPEQPNQPGGFGPYGWTWPARTRLLHGLEPRFLVARTPDLADSLDWRYFHSAPADQQIDTRLQSSDWFELHGMHPNRASVRYALPAVAAHARAVLLTPSGASAAEPLPMVADTLIIDAIGQRFSLVWRGNGRLTFGQDALPQLGLLVSVAPEGREPSWPAEGELGPLAPLFAQMRQAGSGARPPIFAEISALAPAGDVAARAPRRPARPPQVVVPPDGPTPEVGVSADPPTTSPAWVAPEPSEPQPIVLTPIPPIRTNDDIPVVTACGFESAILAWQLRPPQDSLIVIAKATYDIVEEPGGESSLPVTVALRARERADFCRGATYFDNDPMFGATHPSDVALLKPRADVTLFGYAHPPHGRAREMKVRFLFGDGQNRGRGFDKAIHVLGPREWKRGLIGLSPGPPGKLEPVPLAYARAFGGADHLPNPCGRGRGGLLLPNLELADKHVSSPSDNYGPACFAPICSTWAARWTGLGTYDRKWFKTRWPYFPNDFDWAHFQEAPRDQQLDALSGEEPFIVEGVHPKHLALAGKLPGDRARCFLVLRPEAGGGLREVEVRLDTVSFDFAELKVDLVWRGASDVEASDAPEVLALFVMRERRGATAATKEQVEAAYLAAITPKEPQVESPPPAREAATEDEDEAPSEEDERELDALEAALQQELAAAGLDDLRPENLPPPDPKQIAETLRAGGATQGEIDEVLDALEPPKASPEDESPALVALRDLVVQMLAEGASFEGFDFEGGDFEDLDFSGANLALAILQRGTFDRCNFENASLVEAQAGEASFEGARFDRANLNGIDMSHANLRSASFDGAELIDAELISASGIGASFVGARAAGAELESGDWSRANFQRIEAPHIDLQRSVLDAARFEDAVIAKATFRAARGEKVTFKRAILEDAAFEEAHFAGCTFTAVDARGAVFDNAVIDQADLRGADLTGASLQRTKCRKADLTSATLVEANLMRADLRGSQLNRANLMNATLEAADLTIADLRDANLFGAGLWKAALTDAKLDGTFIAQSSLVMREPDG